MVTNALGHRKQRKSGRLIQWRKTRNLQRVNMIIIGFDKGVCYNEKQWLLKDA